MMETPSGTSCTSQSYACLMGGPVATWIGRVITLPSCRYTLDITHLPEGIISSSLWREVGSLAVNVFFQLSPGNGFRSLTEDEEKKTRTR